MRLRCRYVLLVAVLCLSVTGIAFGRDPGGGSSGPYWKVTITGVGTVTASGIGSFAWGTSSASYIAAGAMSVSSGKSLTVTTSGSYRVKMEWVNPDGTPAANPAKTVITKTSSGARWYGASGNSSNGLGTPQVPTSSPYGGSSSGDKWEAKDGLSGLIQYDVTVSASVTVQGPVGGYSYGVSAGVNANAFPVTVYLVQSIRQNGIENALIGQGITGNLNTPPFTASAQTGHAWSVGGDTFQSWTVSADQSNATLVTGPGPLNQRTFHCYWKDQITTTISCTATVQTPSGALTVTGEQKLVVWLPYYSMGANVGPVGIYGDILRAGGATLDPPGIRIVGAVGTPALFQPIGVGKWEFVQLCNLLRQLWSSFSPLPNTVSTGGIFMLDNQCPYDVASSASSTATNPISDETSDSPEMSLFSWTAHAKAQDSFQMFMLYLPPGFDVQWAPLARLDWQWNADTSKSGSVWTPTPPGAVTANGSNRCTIHPTWTSVFGNQ